MITVLQRKTLIERYIPLANSLAWKKAQRTPRKVTIEELKSAAYMGLVKYANKFDCEDLSTFQPHARIIGEMKDYLRSIGWGPRGRKSVETNDFAACRIEHEFPEESDFSFMSSVSEGEKAILIAKYVDGKRLREISEDVNLSIGRVSQIIKKSSETIREQYGKAA